MALPIVGFQPETFAQTQPIASGISTANMLYQQAIQNKYLQPMLQQQLRQYQLNNQILQPQAQYAPQLTQADLAYKQAQTPYLNAQTQGITQGQIPLQQAQGAYYGSEAQKNQFLNRNPTTLLPGMAGQIGAYNVLRAMAPQIFGAPQSAAPTQDQTAASNLASGIPTTIPGMPSAGAMTGVQGTPGNALLPQNAYGSSPSPLMSNVAGGQGQQQQSPFGGGLPSVQSFANLMMQSQMAPVEKNIAQASWYNQKAKLANFAALPKDQQNYLIAQAGGMGIDPTTAMNAYSNGATVSDLAKAKGLDPTQLPSPLYPANTATIGLIQKRNQALNEINTMMPNITNAMAPYSQKIMDYSPKQVVQAISNSNPDAQMRLLAARGVMPEMSSLRLKVMNGNFGIEAIKEVTDKSMGNIEAFQGLVTPQVYAGAQKYIDQWINQGAQAATKVGLAGSTGNLPQGQGLTTANSSASSQMVSLKAPNGETFRVPANNLNEALKRGAVQI